MADGSMDQAGALKWGHEDEDRNLAPRRPEQRLLYLFFRTSLAVRAIMVAVGQTEGITLSQYTLLSLISASSTVTTAKLARRVEISPQSVNEIVRSLQRAGYIYKEPSGKDRRLQILHLTAEGRRQLDKAELAMDRAEALCFDGSTERDQRALADIMTAIIDRGRAIGASGQPMF